MRQRWEITRERGKVMATKLKGLSSLEVMIFFKKREISWAKGWFSPLKKKLGKGLTLGVCNCGNFLFFTFKL